ncbi:MAG: hypothetical protein ABEJ42_03950 [Halobacteriaceae archaeon]
MGSSTAPTKRLRLLACASAAVLGCGLVAGAYATLWAVFGETEWPTLTMAPLFVVALFAAVQAARTGRASGLLRQAVMLLTPVGLFVLLMAGLRPHGPGLEGDRVAGLNPHPEYLAVGALLASAGIFLDCYLGGWLTGPADRAGHR